jgi:acetyltransferase-like isoleucine patch superfamily enzyme
MAEPLMSQMLTRLDAWRVVMLSRLLGPGHAVRYLRTPRPGSVAGILTGLGATIGAGTTFKGALVLENTSEDAHSAGDLRHLNIGRNCYVGEGVHLDLAHRIDVGDNVVISGRVTVLTHADCNRSTYLATHLPRICAPVTVRDGAWLGYGATIFPGVTVGAEAVIAAGSLLRDDAEPRWIHAGTPAKALRRVEPES